MKILVNGGCQKTTAHIFHTYPHLREYLGWMSSPRHGYKVETMKHQGARAVHLDNSAYSGFDKNRYLSMLEKWSHADIPVVWVTLPDIVGAAKPTLDLFWHWYPHISFHKALVGQDGMEDLELPWAHFKCLFIGGTTEWKLSTHAADLIREGKARGKQIHMGRVNSDKRLRYAYRLGVDTVDGTGYSKYNRKELLKALNFLDGIHRQMELL